MQASDLWEDMVSGKRWLDQQQCCNGLRGRTKPCAPGADGGPVLLAGTGAGSRGHPRPWLLGDTAVGWRGGAASTKGQGSSVRGVCRSGQHPALAALSWLWLVLTNPVARTSPDNPVSLAGFSLTRQQLSCPLLEGRARAGSPGQPGSSRDAARLPFASPLCTDHSPVLQLGGLTGLSR